VREGGPEEQERVAPRIWMRATGAFLLAAAASVARTHSPPAAWPWNAAMNLLLRVSFLVWPAVPWRETRGPARVVRLGLFVATLVCAGIVIVRSTAALLSR
jgi:hypothetical protein